MAADATSPSIPPRVARLIPHLLRHLDLMVETGQRRVTTQQLSRALNNDIDTVIKAVTALVRQGRIVRAHAHAGGIGHLLSRDESGVFHFDRPTQGEISRDGGAVRHTRRCLRCGDDFPSEGSHNRLCEACRAHATQHQHLAGIGDPSITDYGMSFGAASGGRVAPRGSRPT